MILFFLRFLLAFLLPTDREDTVLKGDFHVFLAEAGKLCIDNERSLVFDYVDSRKPCGRVAVIEDPSAERIEHAVNFSLHVGELHRTIVDWMPFNKRHSKSPF